MKEQDIVLFRIDRKTGLLLLGALAVVLGGFAVAEQLTIATSYPVPSGVYNQLITTGDSGAVPADTTFNRNKGNTLLVPATNAAGMVGVGTSAPAAKLDVNGTVNIRPNGLLGLGSMAADPLAAGSRDGQIYYNTTSAKFMGFSGGAWASLGGGQPTVLDPGNTLSLPGGDCASDALVNLKFLGVNRACFAFLSKHIHNSGGSCGRYEDNGCYFNAATGFVQGLASSGTTWCGYVCFN